MELENPQSAQMSLMSPKVGALLLFAMNRERRVMLLMVAALCVVYIVLFLSLQGQTDRNVYFGQLLSNTDRFPWLPDNFWNRTFAHGDVTSARIRFYEEMFHYQITSNASDGDGEIKYGIKEILNAWQNVTSSGDLIAYSAYFEERSHEKTVRVLVLYANECHGYQCPVTADVVCILWFRNRKLSVVENAVLYIVPDHHFKRYKTAIVTCPLKDDRQPVYVSLVDIAQPELPPLNYIEISYNALNRNRKRNFTMCLSPLHGKSATNMDFIQYFELNRLLGAQYFVVYNYSLTDSTNEAILNYYRQLGLVRVIQWQLPPFVEENDGVWYRAQLTMLNDCVYRNKGVTEYIITTDIDEFIVPLYKSGWMELLSEQEAACEYNFRSVVLRKSSSVKTNESIDTAKFPLSAVLRKERAVHIFPYKVRSKFIITPACIVVAGIHSMVEIAPQQKIVPTKAIPLNKGLTYHYADETRAFTMTGSGYHDDTLDKYSTPLVERTKLVLSEIDIWK